MKVLYYGWEYEGGDAKSLRVFEREEDAKAFRDQQRYAREESPTYDYTVMLEREVQE
jgi:hypothetical protein